MFVEGILTLLDLQIHQLAQFRGQAFNVGDGADSVSLCEATGLIEKISSRSISITYSDQARKGDIVLH